MDAIILKCHKGAQFHFGQFALDSNMSLDSTSIIPHSDTLFSAIIRIAAQFNNRTDTDLLVDEFRKGNIKISSGNFCLEYKNDFTYFFPKPICIGIEANENYKRIKKIKFVSKDVLDKAHEPEQWFDESLCVIVQDSFVFTKDEIKNINSKKVKFQNVYSITSSPKVKVHAKESLNSLYNQSNIEIGCLNIDSELANVHYYFLLEVHKNTNSKMVNLLNTAIDLIPETGIGGERSTGCGNINSIKRDRNIEFSNSESPFHLSMSLIAPQKHEQKSYKYFDLINRGGRNVGREKSFLKTVRFIKEGAVLKDNMVNGNLIDISPDISTEIPYLRNGLAFLIPLPENYMRNEKQ